MNMRSIESLNAKIRRISKRISESDVESNVVYLNDKVINIGRYTNCSPDKCQADGSKTKISFFLGERKYLIFSSSVKSPKGALDVSLAACSEAVRLMAVSWGWAARAVQVVRGRPPARARVPAAPPD